MRWLPNILLILVVLASALWWYYSQPSKPIEEETKLLPDYTLSNATIRQVNAVGHRQHHLQVASSLHYPDSYSELDQPILTTYDRGDAQWLVQSQRGTLSDDYNLLWLLGEASLQQLDPGNTPLIIYSQDVQINQQQQLASSQSATRIIHQHGETHSIGMNAFFDTQQVELLSVVKSHYAAP